MVLEDSQKTRSHWFPKGPGGHCLHKSKVSLTGVYFPRGGQFIWNMCHWWHQLSDILHSWDTMVLVHMGAVTRTEQAKNMYITSSWKPGSKARGNQIILGIETCFRKQYGNQLLANSYWYYHLNALCSSASLTYFCLEESRLSIVLFSGTQAQNPKSPFALSSPKLLLYREKENTDLNFLLRTVTLRNVFFTFFFCGGGG